MMKTQNRLLIGVIIITFSIAGTNAQQYEADIASGQKIVVEGLLGKIIIKNHSGSKLLIECNKLGETSEKSKGLKEIYGGSVDNTGIGISIKEMDKITLVSGASKRSEDAEYTFNVPENTSMKVDYNSPFGHDDIEVEGFSGEFEVSMLNAGIELENITGPVTIHTINGNIKAIFNTVKQDSPSSITSINGEVEAILPSSTKANLKLSTFHGEIYSDCDIKFDNQDNKEDMKLIGGHSKTEGKLNGGGVEMTFSSINGSIYIRKK